MRKILTTGVLAAGLFFGLGNTADDGTGDTLRLVYSTDLRGELHPCG